MNNADLMRLRNTRLRSCYEGIINANTMEEVDKVVEDSGYEFSNIRSNFSHYEFIYSKEEVEKCRKNILKYTAYREIKMKKLREEKRKLQALEKMKLLSDEATLVIASYLENFDEPYEAFLAEHKINNTKFKKYIEVIKEYNKPLYDEYISKKEAKEAKERETAKLQLTNLVNAIKNGIDENGEKRDFDVLDYFNITDIPVDRLVAVGRPILWESELMYIKKFAKVNERCTKVSQMDEECILNGVMIIDNKEITREENEAIINYLKENSFPVNSLTHRAALKRYLKRLLAFDQDNKTLKLINE